MPKDHILIDKKNNRVYYQQYRGDILGYGETYIMTIEQFEELKNRPKPKLTLEQFGKIVQALGEQ